MESRNVETYRAGHEAFNRRDFDAMVKEYAESISWIDQARGSTIRTPQEFKSDFLEGWIQASSDCQITDARYTDAGDMVVARFTCRGTHDGPLGPFPSTGKEWTCRSARCGTSTPTVESSAVRSTTTRSPCSRSWIYCRSPPEHERRGLRPHRFTDRAADDGRRWDRNEVPSGRGQSMIVRAFSWPRGVENSPPPASSCRAPRMPGCRA